MAHTPQYPFATNFERVKVNKSKKKYQLHEYTMKSKLRDNEQVI
jgi:hypothetical protein